MEQKFILASQNKGKLKEMQAILQELGITVITPSDVSICVQVEETGTTFLENAILKATAVADASGLPAIADDSGLCCDGLDGRPGVYSARYGGPSLDDAGRCQLLLKEMSGIDDRDAHFICSIACAFPDGRLITAEGMCSGEITREPAGDGGFGYDPVFWLPSRGKTFAQLSPEEKAAHSHRGAALSSFSKKLKAELENK